MRKAWILTAAAVVAMPLTLTAFPAWADSACSVYVVSGFIPVATAEGSGFSCHVGSIDFSNISVVPTTSHGGQVTLTGFTIYSQGGESGLTLNYSANTFGNPNATADVGWTYNVLDNVVGNTIVDAYAAVSGSVMGSGVISVDETLSNGATLSINIPPGPDIASTTFTGVSSLSAMKDLENYTGSSAGNAQSSLLTNAFSESVTAVPEPATWAMMLLGFVGLFFGFRQSRRRVSVA